MNYLNSQVTVLFSYFIHVTIVSPLISGIIKKIALNNTYGGKKQNNMFNSLNIAATVPHVY